MAGGPFPYLAASFAGRPLASLPSQRNIATCGTHCCTVRDAVNSSRTCTQTLLSPWTAPISSSSTEYLLL